MRTDQLSTRTIVLAVVATVRATRLVTHDYITEDVRKSLQRRLPEKGAYLIGCPWCASFWIGMLVAAIVVRFPNSRVVTAGLIALAGSQASGLLAHLDSLEDLGETDS